MRWSFQDRAETVSISMIRAGDHQMARRPLRFAVWATSNGSAPRADGWRPVRGAACSCNVRNKTGAIVGRAALPQQGTEKIALGFHERVRGRHVRDPRPGEIDWDFEL